MKIMAKVSFFNYFCLIAIIAVIHYSYGQCPASQAKACPVCPHPCYKILAPRCHCTMFRCPPQTPCPPSLECSPPSNIRAKQCAEQPGLASMPQQSSYEETTEVHHQSSSEETIEMHHQSNIIEQDSQNAPKSSSVNVLQVSQHPADDQDSEKAPKSSSLDILQVSQHPVYDQDAQMPPQTGQDQITSVTLLNETEHLPEIQELEQPNLQFGDSSQEFGQPNQELGFPDQEFVSFKKQEKYFRIRKSQNSAYPKYTQLFNYKRLQRLPFRTRSSHRTKNFFSKQLSTQHLQHSIKTLSNQRRRNTHIQHPTTMQRYLQPKISHDPIHTREKQSGNYKSTLHSVPSVRFFQGKIIGHSENVRKTQITKTPRLPKAFSFFKRPIQVKSLQLSPRPLQRQLSANSQVPHSAHVQRTLQTKQSKIPLQLKRKLFRSLPPITHPDQRSVHAKQKPPSTELKGSQTTSQIIQTRELRPTKNPQYVNYAQRKRTNKTRGFRQNPHRIQLHLKHPVQSQISPIHLTFKMQGGDQPQPQIAIEQTSCTTGSCVKTSCINDSCSTDVTNPSYPPEYPDRMGPEDFNKLLQFNLPPNFNEPNYSERPCESTYGSLTNLDPNNPQIPCGNAETTYPYPNSNLNSDSDTSYGGEGHNFQIIQSQNAPYVPEHPKAPQNIDSPGKQENSGAIPPPNPESNPSVILKNCPLSHPCFQPQKPTPPNPCTNQKHCPASKSCIPQKLDINHQSCPSTHPCFPRQMPSEPSPCTGSQNSCPVASGKEDGETCKKSTEVIENPLPIQPQIQEIETTITTTPPPTTPPTTIPPTTTTPPPTTILPRIAHLPPLPTSNVPQRLSPDVVLADTACQNMIPPPQNGQCPPKFWIIQDRCYFFDLRDVNWQTAFQMCKSMGLALMSVETDVEWEGLKSILKITYADHAEWWVAGKKWCNQWIWQTTGQSMTFTSWDKEQPDNLSGDEDCVMINSPFQSNFNYFFNDRSCYARYPFICEKSL